MQNPISSNYLIDLMLWQATYLDLKNWAEARGIPFSYIDDHGEDSRSSFYRFENLEDVTAFKLSFSKKKPSRFAGYKGVTEVDTSFYYCPYIPLMNYK